MTAAVELELGIQRMDARSWAVEVRCSIPDNDSDIRFVRSTPGIDAGALAGAVDDDVGYGRILADSLFADDDVRDQFSRALAAADDNDVALRVRLFIGPGASELHALRWETLQDAGRDGPLLANERILFSRYLSSLDWRPVTVRPKNRVRSVVMVANPTSLDSWRREGRELAPIDVDAEMARATAALGRTEVVSLPSGGTASLENLVSSLRGEPDILYVVCHGFIARNEPQLLLENRDGSVARVPGADLVERIRAMRHPPSLVVIASCQSAGGSDDPTSEDDGALAALGPALAEAGVPAVVAMQGNVTMATVAAFLPVLFAELHRDGQIDRAVAVARNAVRDRPDWWAPVLFMRLKSGRIWYKPGFTSDFEKWPAILADLRAEPCKCTPILGPGLTDALLGTRQELAARWASTYHFPMAPHGREDLPQVAQYLAVSQNDRFPREGLRAYMRQELLDRYGDDLSEQARGGTLDELMTAVGDHLRSTNPVEPHTVLARLPLPIYVTAHPANLLASALLAEGKRPEVELCRWNNHVDWPPSVFEREPTYRPRPDRPLVFHLFGRLEQPESLVVTEEDYLDFLIGLTSNKDGIPSVVRRALIDSSLLFLGFRMDEWEFRVLFRSLMSQEGGERRSRYSHVAVQIDPEGSQTLEPERARRYLERAFHFNDADLSIYWGSTDDFVRELGQAWEGGAG